MSYDEMSPATIVSAAVESYHAGDGQPLRSLIEAGTREVMDSPDARALILEKLAGQGRPAEPTSATTRVQIVSYLYILQAYGLKLGDEIDHAAKFFSRAPRTIQDIWKHHQPDWKFRPPKGAEGQTMAWDSVLCAYRMMPSERVTQLWLPATEEGYRLKREAGRKQAQEIRREAYDLATGDLYGEDGLTEIRQAAAAGNLKHYDRRKAAGKRKLA